MEGGSAVSLSFTFRRSWKGEETAKYFRLVQIDGTEIAASGYAPETSGFDISLLPDTLNRLTAGKHTITAVFEDGRAEAVFRVTDSSLIAMFRMYNPNSGEHFYTGSTAERDSLIQNGWTYAGIAFRAPVRSDHPMYRLYNPSAGDHHYTGNANERDMLVKAGWKSEGIAFHASDSSGVPMYRLYNPNAVTGSHHYTSSTAERNQLSGLGWKDEGTGFYAAG